MPKRKKKRSYDSTLFVLSHSSLETMKKCTRSWWYRYILKYYPEGDPPAHTEFGNYLHDVAENYDGSGMDTIKKICGQVRHKHKFGRKYNPPDVVSEYKAKEKVGLVRLRDYWDKYIPAEAIKNNKVFRERQLFFPINEEFDYLAKIDLLYQTAPGEWICADYKTGKKADVYKQLAYYWYGLKRKAKAPIKKMTFHTIYLCDLEVDEWVVEDSLDEDWEDMVDNTLYTNMRRVKNLGYNKEDKDKWKMKPGPLCPFCDYYNSGDCPGKDELDGPS